MQLLHHAHLAYCSNIHPGENWSSTQRNLSTYATEMKRRVSPNHPYAIGLRLGNAAVTELLDKDSMLSFQRWLEKENCYVFTINGFPYGQFHGTRVKEQVYRPEWHQETRVEYTKSLFKILAEIVPPGISGSVSTLPGSFKGFAITADEVKRMEAAFADCAEYIARLSDRTGKDLHLGIEPEPLCYVETSEETVDFIHRIGRGEAIKRCLGVNYDTCHLAVEYESAQQAWKNFKDGEVRISKLHLSSALKLKPSDEALHDLKAFTEDTYLHQTIIRHEDGTLVRYQDLPLALEAAKHNPRTRGEEWRVHFHVPLHTLPEGNFQDTRDHLCDVLDLLALEPSACQHLEMETYTWGVLPEELKTAAVEDQLQKEYAWCLSELKKRGLAAS
jgi:hypothetical protein